MADQLLRDILGPHGAQALERAVASRPRLLGGVRPRAALAWALQALAHGYRGAAPGTPDAAVLVKGEDWIVGVADREPLHGAGAPGLAAVLVALAEGPSGPVPRGPVMARLGAQLDLLAKAEFEAPFVLAGMRTRLLAKAGAPKPPKAPGPQHAGVEPPGPPAAARPPIAPAAPTPPKMGAQKPTVPKPPKAPGAPAMKSERSTTVRLTKAELATPCAACGRPQLTDVGLVACACFDLAKCEVVPDDDAFVVRFPADERDVFVAFVKAVRCGE